MQSGNQIRLYTSSGNIRGYIQSTESNDGHLIIATSGGEDISFRDGGLGGQWNQIIRGDGQVLINSRLDVPIMYDRNSTGYYADPASTTRLNRLYINARNDNYYVGTVNSTNNQSNWQNLTNVNGQFTVTQYNAIQNYSNSPTGVYTYGSVLSTRTANHSFQLYSAHTGDLAYKTQWNNDNYSGWLTIPAYGRNGGNSGGYLYAGRYYDSNNTGYFVDPASDSTFNTATFNGRLKFDNYLVSKDSGGMMGNYNQTGTAEKVIWTIGESWPIGNMYGLAYGYDGTYGHHLRLKNNGGTYHRISFASQGAQFIGNVQADGQMRAPIFYDRNNTGYYIHGDSTSNLNALNVNSLNVGGNPVLTGTSIQNYMRNVDNGSFFNITDDMNSAEVAYQLSGGGATSRVTKVDDPTAPAAGCFEVNGQWYPTHSDYIKIDANSQYIFEVWVRFVAGTDSSSALYMGGSAYNASKSYFGNTNRYWGASYMEIDANTRNSGEWYKVTGRLGGNGGQAFTAGTEYIRPLFLFNYAGNSTHRTRYCGLKLYKSEQTIGRLHLHSGTRFSDLNTDNRYPYIEGEGQKQIKIQNSSGWTKIGALNTSYTYYYTDRPSNYFDKRVETGADMRAPIFYDRNDTGYYANPASTSYFNDMRANIFYDRNNTSYYGNFASTSRINRADLNDTRSDIFYDRNNTGYYVNPASGTQLYGMTQISGGHGDSEFGVRLLSGNNGAGTGEVNLRMWCSEPGRTWDWAGFGYNVTNNNGSPSGFGRINTGFGQGYWRFSTSGNVYMYNTNTSGTRYQTMEWRSDNTVIANNYLTGANSLRAPIFYDSDNTGYYVNPASQSHMNTLTLAGNRIGFINSSFDAEIRVSDGNPNGTGAEFVFYGDTVAGNAQLTAEVGNFTANVRTPIFYDRDNTGYYSNPASTSNFNSIKTATINSNYYTRTGHNVGHLVGSYNSVGGNSAKTNPIYTIGSSYNPGDSTLSNMYGVGYSHTNASFISFTGASGWGWYAAADGDARVYICGSNGTVSAKGSMYAPSFYDSNDTNYFVNPAATSQMNQIDVNGNIRHRGDTNTYYGFHSNDQWRVVTGGSERLEVNNSQIYMTRELRCTQDVIAFYSDERLKDNLGKIESPLDKISKLDAFYYVNNDLAKEKGFEDDKKQIGLSAQQVKEVMPEVVHSAPFDTDFDEDGNMFSTSGEDYLTLKYDRLVPLLVEGIKEQTEIVKSQQKEIDELKEMVKLLLNK
jgi:hypothetical protein